MASFGTTDSCQQHEQHGGNYNTIINSSTSAVHRRHAFLERLTIYVVITVWKDRIAFAGHSDNEDVLFCATKDTGATNDYYSSISPQ